MYIDATVIKGETRSFGCSIEFNENADIFKPFDLNPYSIIFEILGSATADAEVLVSHLITQNSTISQDGIINDAANGQFIFTVTAEDTNKIGLGQHPVRLKIVDAASLETIYSLTEGELNGEFSKIQVVLV